MGILPAAWPAETRTRSSRIQRPCGRRWSFFIAGACNSTHKNNAQNFPATLRKRLRTFSFPAPRGANRKTSSEPAHTGTVHRHHVVTGSTPSRAFRVSPRFRVSQHRLRWPDCQRSTPWAKSQRPSNPPRPFRRRLALKWTHDRLPTGRQTGLDCLAEQVQDASPTLSGASPRNTAPALAGLLPPHGLPRGQLGTHSRTSARRSYVRVPHADTRVLGREPGG